MNVTMEVASRHHGNVMMTWIAQMVQTRKCVVSQQFSVIRDLRIFLKKKGYSSQNRNIQLSGKKNSMHNQVGPQGWFPKNIERFYRLGSLAEGIL